MGGVFLDFFSAYDKILPGQVGPVYLLYGREYLLVDRFVKRLIECTDAGVVARYDFEEDGLENPLLELDTVSLFEQQPVVQIRNCTFFLSQGKSGTQADLLEKYIQSPAPGRVLVMTVDGDKLDERKRLTKAVKRHLVVDCQTPKQPLAMRYLTQVAHDTHMDLDVGALDELWRRTGSISQAMNELSKLAVYASGRLVTREDVSALVENTMEDTVFDWVDHVAQGRISMATQSLQAMRYQGYDPLALIAMLVRQIRMMWFAKSLSTKGMTPDDIAKVAKVHPFAMRVAMKQSGSFGLTSLESLLALAADCEYDIKRGRRDGLQALELLMLTAAHEAKRLRQR